MKVARTVLGILAVSILIWTWPAAVEATVTPSTTLSYGTDPLQTAEFFPAGPKVAILVHGGGFDSSTGDAIKLTGEATDLQKSGVTAVIVNYRSDATAPAFPNEVNDLVAGTLFALAHTGAARASLIGGSSGATLVADAAVQLGGSVSTVVTLSGVMDFTTAEAYFGTIGTKVGDIHVNNIIEALGPHSPASESPVTLVGPTLRGQRWYVFNGNTEVMPVAQADEITAALKAANIPVTETIVTTAEHSWKYWTLVKAQILAAVS